MNAANIFKSSPSAHFRIEFKDGDIFVLTQLRDCSDSADHPLTWVGKIVDSENISEKRRKLHRKGNYLEFCLSDISRIN